MVDINVTPYDDPATPADEGTTNVNGMLVSHPTVPVNSGTGGYTPFLRQQGPGQDSASQGFNTDDPDAFGNGVDTDADASWTQSLLVGDLPIVYRNNIAYYEIRLDLNETNNNNLDAFGRPNPWVALSEFQIYTSNGQATYADYNTDFSVRAFDEADGYKLVYDLDAGTDRTLLLADGASGSGNDDYGFFIPVSAFGTYDPTLNFTLFAQFGPNPEEDATFEEFRIQKVMRINGTKFNDADGDGVKDAGETGLAGFTMFIDRDGDNKLDANELTAKSGADGSFTFYSLTAGTYIVREILSTVDIDAAYLATLSQAQIDSYLPPAGLWDTTTGDASGDHSVIVVSGSNSTMLVGNHALTPNFTVLKSVTSITDGADFGGSGQADSAGDVINYSIVVSNTGEVDLTGYSISDPNASSLVRGLDTVGDNDANFEVGEVWNYTATHIVTQAELNSRGTSITGALDTDGDTDNRVTVTTNEVGPKSSDVATPLVYAPNFTVLKSVTSITDGADFGGSGQADSAGDVINYSIVVTNTGNIDLTGYSISDPNANTLVRGLDTVGDNDANFEVGEVWNYTATHIVTQAELNSRGTSITGALDTDGDTDNRVTVTTNEVGPKNSDVATPLVYAPNFTVLKSVTSITDGADFGGSGQADSAGDVINYSIVVSNTGNIDLTGYSISDPNANTLVRGLDTVGDNDANFEVGEVWNYTATHIITQAELDSRGTNIAGALDTDGDTDNRVTVTTNEVGPKNSDVATPLVYAPNFTVLKSVTSITDGPDFGASGQADSAGDVINYSIVVSNTGNVTLTGYSISDPNANTLVRGLDTVGDNDANFEVGEIWNYTATHIVTQAELDGLGTDIAGAIDGDGDTDNRVTVTTTEAGTKFSEVSTPLVVPNFTVVKSVTSITDGADFGGSGQADSAGDVINYSIVVTNTGNVNLTGYSISDPNATSLVRGLDTVGDNDANFEVGEVWTYTATHLITQAELDSRGTSVTGALDTDGDTDNRVTVTTNEIGPKSSDVATPLVYAPNFTVLKSVTSITDGADFGGSGQADSAGDVINYSIVVTNTGNVTLTGYSISDPNANTLVRGLDTVGDNDANFEVGEVWTYTATHIITQAELDSRGTSVTGALDTDGDTDNRVTVTTNEVGPKSSDVATPLVYTPHIDLEKYVSVTGVAGTYIDADTAALGPQNVNLGAPVYFRVTVTNDGNITLTNPLITDVNTSNGGNITITLYDPSAAPGSRVMAGAIFSGDTGNDGILSVGETWTFTYSQPFDAGDHVNTAYVTTTQGATDNDAAHYFSLVNDGPGVRTPGFWQNLKNGGLFWDGTPGNEKSGPGFPDGELLYAIRDLNGDGVADGTNTKGLLIGDYNKNGLTDANEDTLFISYDDARTLINANESKMSDGVAKIGRDVVASWLNFLAGNNIGLPTDVQSPHHFIDDAIDYLQIFGDDDAGIGSTTENFDVYAMAHGAVKTGTADWTSDFPGGDHSGSEIHSALDYYNNTGMTSPSSAVYAHDADDSMFLTALKVYETLI